MTIIRPQQNGGSYRQNEDRNRERNALRQLAANGEDSHNLLSLYDITDPPSYRRCFRARREAAGRCFSRADVSSTDAASDGASLLSIRSLTQCGSHHSTGFTSTPSSCMLKCR